MAKITVVPLGKTYKFELKPAWTEYDADLLWNGGSNYTFHATRHVLQADANHPGNVDCAPYQEIFWRWNGDIVEDTLSSRGSMPFRAEPGVQYVFYNQLNTTHYREPNAYVYFRAKATGVSCSPPPRYAAGGQIARRALRSVADKQPGTKPVPPTPCVRLDEVLGSTGKSACRSSRAVRSAPPCGNRRVIRWRTGSRWTNRCPGKR